MATPVIQICQPGFDVRSCPDWAYLFNSDWPSLSIAFEKTIPNPGGAPVVLNHNLGFIPLTVLYNKFNSPNRSYGRTPVGISVTKTTASIEGVGGAATVTVRCYNVDISKEQSYPLPQSAQAKLPYNNQFGIKIAKNERLIYSNNLNDFILHSRAQSPAILQVATEQGQYITNVNPGSQYAGPWIVYPLKTSYIPWIYIAIQTSTNPVTYSFESVNAVQVVNNKIIFPLIGNTAGTLVVLRDPLFYPNTVRVVY